MLPQHGPVRKEISEIVTAGVLQELRESGYVIVPREPTPEMLRAAWDDTLDEDARAIWKTMIEYFEGLRKEDGTPKA